MSRTFQKFSKCRQGPFHVPINVEGSLLFSGILLEWSRLSTQQPGKNDMKTSIAIAVLLLGWATASEAVIYQYTDDSGQTHYTNDLASVPAEKLDQVTEIEETESDATAPAPAYSGPIYPLLQESQTKEDKARERERAQRKADLEAEYQALLKEKEALDNDASFQKRRNKRKYQNRPYIQELVAREAEIKKRLLEVQRELKRY
jgi:hypothetical protein